MNYSIIFLLLLGCISCSKEEFHTVESFNDQFTHGLFISKLTNKKIPYQFDYQMGQQYVLVHVSFKEQVIKQRKDSLKEAKYLSLINLASECSQKNLSDKFKESKVFHMTLSKRSIPMIRVTNKDHSSKKVTAILSEYDWRCE